MINTLVLIPARGGSKGIPKKNIKEFSGQPLTKYTIDFAMKHFPLENICLSSDSDEIIQYGEELGLLVEFKRPDNLATDASSTRDVILHALQFYAEKGKVFDYVILLQPTTPIRNDSLILTADNLAQDNDEFDMLVSVKLTKTSPYFNLFEEDNNGFLSKSKKGNYTRRQDSPPIYEYTGAFYVIRTDSILSHDLSEFKKIRKIVIENPIENIDLDTPLDWEIGEHLLHIYGR